MDDFLSARINDDASASTPDAAGLGESEHFGANEFGDQPAEDNRRLAAENAFLRTALRQVSHDLRNPLVSIRGLTHLLAEHPLVRAETELESLLKGIEAGCERGLDLVTQILDQALERGVRSASSFEVVNIYDIVAAAAQTLEGAAREKNIQIVRPGASHPPLNFTGSRGNLQAAIENLLANAIRFTPNGETVLLNVCGSDESVTISVRDYGTGIDESRRHQIFHEFQRGPDAVTSDDDEGFGLGLHFCRQIITAHAGTIDCRNLPDRGCEFVIQLPRK